MSFNFALKYLLQLPDQVGSNLGTLLLSPKLKKF